MQNLSDRQRKDHLAVLVDPVREKVDRYLALLAYQGLRLEAVIDTHTHADHRTASIDLKELTGAKVIMHSKAPAPHVNVHVEDGEEIPVGDLGLKVLYTPGHTPDGISLFTGDRVAGYMLASAQEPRLVWDRRALWPFICTGVFETFSILLIITALSIGPVVVIAPSASTCPVWALIGARLFLKDVERIGLKAAIGILSVVAGTVAIHLGQ